MGTFFLVGAATEEAALEKESQREAREGGQHAHFAYVMQLCQKAGLVSGIVPDEKKRPSDMNGTENSEGRRLIFAFAPFLSLLVVSSLANYLTVVG